MNWTEIERTPAYVSEPVNVPIREAFLKMVLFLTNDEQIELWKELQYYGIIQ